MAEPDATRGRVRAARPVVWLAGAALAFPAAIGLFWLARDSGAARPLCGDRPGSYYPSCQLPAPFGAGAPPTTTGGFQP
jgi:hypothetical protein